MQREKITTGNDDELVFARLLNLSDRLFAIHWLFIKCGRSHSPPSRSISHAVGNRLTCIDWLSTNGYIIDGVTTHSVAVNESKGELRLFDSLPTSESGFQQEVLFRRLLRCERASISPIIFLHIVEKDVQRLGRYVRDFLKVLADSSHQFFLHLSRSSLVQINLNNWHIVLLYVVLFVYLTPHDYSKLTTSRNRFPTVFSY
jgi:hypothetical protein